jgi:hypothetical protein
MLCSCMVGAGRRGQEGGARWLPCCSFVRTSWFCCAGRLFYRGVLLRLAARLGKGIGTFVLAWYLQVQ